MGALLLFLAAATATAAPAVVTVDAPPGVISAARALGPEVAFFTARARPLASLAELGDPAAQVGTADVAGAKEIQTLLRAGGVKVAGGAVDLMRLIGPNHFPSLFRKNPGLRLFVVRARRDGRAAGFLLVPRSWWSLSVRVCPPPVREDRSPFTQARTCSSVAHRFALKRSSAGCSGGH